MTRFGFVMTTYSATLATGVSALFHPTPALIWNASASAPIGLYRVAPAEPLKHGDLVVMRPPAALATFLAARQYLPLGVPLLKHVAALDGQRVCRFRAAVTIDGEVSATALERDRRGRALPVWRGCRTLAGNDVFLLNTDRPDSLDSRYFGPLPRDRVIGRATAIWTIAAR